MADHESFAGVLPGQEQHRIAGLSLNELELAMTGLVSIDTSLDTLELGEIVRKRRLEEEQKGPQAVPEAAEAYAMDHLSRLFTEEEILKLVLDSHAQHLSDQARGVYLRSAVLDRAIRIQNEVDGVLGPIDIDRNRVRSSDTRPLAHLDEAI